MTCFESWQLASYRTWQARAYTSIANKNGLVTVLGGVVLWSNHQTTALPSTPIPSLYNVNKLMLVLQGPIDLIVVSCPKINHDALASEEEHHCRLIIQFIQGVKVRNLSYINEVDNGKVLYGLSN